MFDVTKAKMAELVTYYNANSGKPAIKKFADRKTAERRVAALVPAADKSKKPSKAKGTMKSKVIVDGIEYRSVKQAFEKLKLPLGRHIGFRMKLKAAGKLDFEHDDKKTTFKTVS